MCLHTGYIFLQWWTFVQNYYKIPPSNVHRWYYWTYSGKYRYIALSGAADICTERFAIQWRNRYSYKARKINRRDSLFLWNINRLSSLIIDGDYFSFLINYDIILMLIYTTFVNVRISNSLKWLNVIVVAYLYIHLYVYSQ
jgi:hypothetical protein